jgi:hypothetical protein
MAERDNDALNKNDVDPAARGVTGEVGSEGGSFGNVEVGLDRGAGTGSEAGETWRPTEEDRTTIVRDETGEGRRNP